MLRLKSVRENNFLIRAAMIMAAVTIVIAEPVESKAQDALPEASDDTPVGGSQGELLTSISRESSWREAKQTKFAYKFGSGFDSFANEREQSQYYGFGVAGDFRAQMMDSLYFRVRGGANLTSGYAQSRFGDNVANNGLYLQEAVLSLRVLESGFARVYAAAGALDQGVFDSPTFVSRQAFPGVKETIFFGRSKEFKFRVWAQQTIPTSKSLSTKTVDAEVTPTFMTETMDLTVQPNDTLEMKAAVTHYKFNSLPSAIALESQLYGNTINETGPSTARFKYGFDGLMARAGLKVSLAPRFSWNAQGSMAQNLAAPEGYRNAQWVQTGLTIGLPGEVEISPVISTFFVEDDVVPGFYNSSFAGHNNRQGYGGQVEAFFRKQGFKLRAEFVDADIINSSLYQSRQQTLSIGFETFYEML